MIRLLINSQDVAPLLSDPPKITDDMQAVCRTLEFRLQASEGLVNYLGQQVELYADDRREFFGFMETRGWEDSGAVTYKVFDPLYFLAKNPDDYYFNSGLTASQRAEEVLKNVGVIRGKLAPTGVTLPASFYKKAAGDQVIIDSLVKTATSGGKKFWLRFDPSLENFGATIFERFVPEEIWAFQRGVNLKSAHYEESLEDMINVVKLVNRETGKTVIKYAADSIADFGPRTQFEEVDKEAAPTMDKDAAAMLEAGNKVKTSISIEGINDGLVMPIFHTGDVVYVEDDITQALGAYYISRIDQTFISSTTVTIAMDLERDPSVPDAPFADAEEEAKGDKKKGTKKGKGVSETPVYNDEMKGLIEKYGLDSQK